MKENRAAHQVAEEIKVEFELVCVALGRAEGGDLTWEIWAEDLRHDQGTFLSVFEDKINPIQGSFVATVFIREIIAELKKDLKQFEPAMWDKLVSDFA